MEAAIKIFLDSVRQACPAISQETLDFLAEGLSVSELKSKHFYIQANSVQKEIGFVCSGLIRAFYVDDRGNDTTVNFIKEGQCATNYPALIRHEPSRYSFQCIEPSVIINLSYEHLQDSCRKFPALERYVRLMVEDVFARQLSRMEGLLIDNAETRYLNFIRENPGLFSRVSLSYLCSYLGIERQTLTRIRKKLAES